MVKIGEANIVDANEGYVHYDNGVLWRIKQKSTYIQLPEELPFAQFPDPPYIIPKP